MPRDAIQKIARKRPPIFWWILANLLAAAFAVISWTTCLYIFNFPEKAANYDLLRKLKRLPPVLDFAPSEAPEGDPANPKVTFKKFFPVEERALDALNARLKRNYLTNFKDGSYLTYVEGDYRVTELRPLTTTDFFHPGLALRLQAFVVPDEVNELNEATDYPVVLELLLPGSEDLNASFFKVGDLLSFNMPAHRLAVLHVSRVSERSEPVICLTAVPLSYVNHRNADGKALPLAPPDPLNLVAPFPVMKENRK